MEFSFAALLEAVAVALLVSVKFAWTVPLLPLRYSFVESLIISLSGGIGGTLFFFYLGTWAMDRLKRLNLFGRKKKKPKKVMSRRNKTIVRIKQRFGLAGIALLTPSLLGIPIGAIVAARYFRSDKRTVIFMLGSVVLWALLFTSLSPFFRELFGLTETME